MQITSLLSLSLIHSKHSQTHTHNCQLFKNAFFILLWAQTRQKCPIGPIQIHNGIVNRHHPIKKQIMNKIKSLNFWLSKPAGRSGDLFCGVREYGDDFHQIIAPRGWDWGWKQSRVSIWKEWIIKWIKEILTHILRRRDQLPIEDVIGRHRVSFSNNKSAN